MSNNSLISKIEVMLSSVRQKNSELSSLADAIRGNGRALERMPYRLIQEMEDLAMDLDIASWQDEDDLGLLPDAISVLAKVDIWLSQLPRDAA
jgi:hypothetical protein